MSIEAARSSRRAALRHLAAPVAVLTVCHEGSSHGTTVSALVRVSQSPLLLGACLRAGSELAGLAVADGRFVVNVLGGAQTALARRFADRSRPAGVAQFAGTGWHPDSYSAAPLLDGALAHYVCRVSGCFVIGDHEVLLGQVVRATSSDGQPLLSYAGGLFSGVLPPLQSTGPSVASKKDEARS
ncbi:flavin reductase domain protein FMN-binding [Parafrankia sp. EAN1pec]|uniref:flavin reductase family protein n=1 Tax=Parafrankia sp. (strain EAN1pec) TaxID=298653 RepID=UPI0000543A63|nr:flavin reductase domain protein FMN-binding [Frankia sp. EAN1pec]